MLKLLVLIFAPLLSLIIFTLGSGLLTTLLTVRLDAAGYGSFVIGLITASYYTGLVFGSFGISNFIKRVGHIRIYSTFASILAVSVLLQGIFVSAWFWIVLRFVSGYAIAALYIAVESWLLVIAPQKMRGQILSLYMISFYAALGAGQFLLNIGNVSTIIPFVIVAMLCTLSIVPLSTTRAACPSMENVSALSFRQLYKVSPSSVIGCFAAGLITAVVYGIMPLFVKKLNLPNSFVASVMGVTIFGAMALQYPVGRISDYFERRKVLIIISMIALVVSFLLMFAAYYWHAAFLVLAFVFGGFSFTLYPVSISHACDYLQGSDIVAATQGLLLANGLGSIVGPVIVPGFINMIGPLGLFVYFILILGVLAVFFSWRRKKKSGPPVEEQQEFVPMSRNSHVVNELDPRVM